MENKRIWEIDFLRGIAIILMVIFHAVFDLNEFGGIDIDYLNGFWFWEGKVSALIFIFLAGISSGLSKNTVKRGIKVLICAMGITLVSYLLFKEQYIRFGILHLLGTSMILFPMLIRIKNVFLFISAIAIALGSLVLENVVVDTGFLIPFGILYRGFATLDYYPLIPYLSVFILGILAYKLYYYKKQSCFNFSYENKYVTMISKNSLIIYLIHQPIIVAVLYLLKYLAQNLS